MIQAYDDKRSPVSILARPEGRALQPRQEHQQAH